MGQALVNADTNEDIREFHHGATINLATGGLKLSIRVKTSDIEESVVFHVNRAITQTESVAPYAIAGDTNGNYKAWTPALGSNTIMAMPHSEAGGAGGAGSGRTSLAIVI